MNKLLNKTFKSRGRTFKILEIGTHFGEPACFCKLIDGVNKKDDFETPVIFFTKFVLRQIKISKQKRYAKKSD